MQLATQVVTARDGVDLFVRRYSPDQPDPDRVLYWVHGIGEHGARHEHIAGEMARRGWTMIVPDLRGHGQSTGIPTHVRSFDDYINDIQEIWQRLDLNSAPPVLLGHSMGGLVVVRAVQEGRIAPSALVVSSPLLGLKLNVNPIKELLGRLIVPFYPAMRFSNGIDAANMTRDSGFASLRRSDTLINKTVTAGWFFAMKEALVTAERDVCRISLPVFALQGADDRTTDPAALADWWNRIPSTGKELVILPGHLHELFFEPDWSDTLNRILDWLERRKGRV